MRRKVEAGKLTIREAEVMIGGSIGPARMKPWPTPTAQDAKQGQHGKSQADRSSLPGRMKREQGSGALNPMWVEWLMGFPVGWTDLKDSETP